MLLNNQEITEEIKEKIKKYPERNDHESMTTQNLWNAQQKQLEKGSLQQYNSTSRDKQKKRKKKQAKA